MSNEATTRMLRMYEQTAEPAGFFASLFQSPRENFYNSEGVEIDIMRDDEDVAIVVTDLSTGYRINSADIYTNKRYIPPIFKEGFSLTGYDQIKRQPGQDPFQDPQYQVNMMAGFMRELRKVEKKIRRAVELQASQVMQTGVVTLTDASGNALYTLSFQPKATHFPTANVAWDAGATATIAADLESLMDVIRDDGKSDPRPSLWGLDAYQAALGNADFLAIFDSRRANQGEIVPMQERANGAKYRGTIDLGNYPLDIFTYNGKYKHPQTGTLTPYMDPAKVCIWVEDTRLDGTWGNVPFAVPPERRVLPFLPPRMQRAGAGGVDMITNAWVDDKGEHLFGGISARPLMIPTAIDTFGCIDSDV